MQSKKNYFSVLFVAFWFFIFVAICFLIASCSSRNDKYVFSGYTFYAVCVGQCENINDVSDLSDQLILEGAAGYILHDELSCVVAFFYTKKADAENVSQKIEGASIKEVTIKKINKSKEEMQDPAIKLALSQLSDTLLSLQKSCISYDKKELSDGELINLYKQAVSKLNERIVSLTELSGEVKEYICALINNFVEVYQNTFVKANMKDELSYSSKFVVTSLLFGIEELSILLCKI